MIYELISEIKKALLSLSMSNMSGLLDFQVVMNDKRRELLRTQVYDLEEWNEGVGGRLMRERI